jgi:hypothetical protein
MNLTTVALCDGEIIGMVGCIPVRFTIKEKEIIGVQEVDVGILPDHRRLDVYFKLAGCERSLLVESKIGFTFGITIEDTSSINLTLFGKKKVGSVPRLIKVLDIQEFLPSFLSSCTILNGVFAMANSVLRFIFPERLLIPKGMQMARVDRFDARFDDFWMKLRNDYPVRTVKDSSYLNWRYADVAHMRNEIFCLESMETNEIFGFIVLGTTRQSNRAGQIYDILTPRSGGTMFTRSLLMHAVNRLRQERAASIECWMFPHTHVFPELARMGFTPREKKGFELHFQPVDIQAGAFPTEILENVENWFLSKGDSDID